MLSTFKIISFTALALVTTSSFSSTHFVSHGRSPQTHALDAKKLKLQRDLQELRQAIEDYNPIKDPANEGPTLPQVQSLYTTFRGFPTGEAPTRERSYSIRSFAELPHGSRTKSTHDSLQPPPLDFAAAAKHLESAIKNSRDSK